MKERSGRDTQDVAVQLLETVKQVACELHPRQHFPVTLGLDSSLDSDFAFDSLGRVELFLRLEKRFGVAMPESLLGSADSPRDLLRVVMGGQRRVSSAGGEIERVDVVPAIVSSVPESSETLTEVLDWHLQQHPDQVHIRLYDPVGEGETISYRQLKAGAMRVAAGLQKLDLQSREPVILMLPTCAEYFYSFFGVLYAGGIPCPIYPPGRLSQVEEHLTRHISVVQNAGAGIMLTQKEALPFADLLLSRVSSLHHLVTVEGVQYKSKDLALPKLYSADTAFLQYTSGSTGVPKGVVLTHANLLANVRAMGEAVQATNKDVFVSWLPLYHDMGLIGAWFGSLYHGAQLIIMSPLTFIARPQHWLEAIHRFRGTLSASPNFGYEHCVRLVDQELLQKLDLSSWRCAFNGAESVSPHTLRQFSDKFKASRFDSRSMMPVYGLAENSVGLAFPPLRRGPVVDLIERESFVKTGLAKPCSESQEQLLEVVSCGRVVPHHQLRVVDGSDRELPDRREGRIQFQGPSSTTGYYRNPEKTAALFHGDWLETGDLGYICDGELYVTGRQKDMIILAGRNIHPDGFEGAIGKIEGVRKGCVAVFGCPDQLRGTERIVVVAETREKGNERKGEISKDINRLAVDVLGQPVDEVVLVAPNAVLKTSSGKIRRSACKTRYEEGGFGALPDAGWLRWLRIGGGVLAGRLFRLMQSVKDYAFAGYAWGMCIFLFCLVLLPFLLMPGITLRWNLIRTAVRCLAFSTRTRIRVEGAENLPLSGDKYILACNHASYLDGYALVGFLPRCVRFVAKGELQSKRLIAYLLGKIDVEYVTRFQADVAADEVARLSQRARREMPLLFFPEGTFTRVPGLRPFHLGAFDTALQQQLPVVPLAIRGTRNMLRADSWFPRQGRIIISIGAPVYPQRVKGREPWQDTLAFRDSVRGEILRLSGEVDLEGGNPDSDRV